MALQEPVYHCPQASDKWETEIPSRNKSIRACESRCPLRVVHPPAKSLIKMCSSTPITPRDASANLNDILETVVLSIPFQLRNYPETSRPQSAVTAAAAGKLHQLTLSDLGSRSNASQWADVHHLQVRGRGRINFYERNIDRAILLR
ncbi:MAG: hypothetical protein JWQ49_382 [Edaphobacter sp.]|nr:hypothetical protein [Edaphobacter sp.]